MYYVCYNPKCQHHIRLSESMRNERYVQVDVPASFISYTTDAVYNIITVERFFYRDNYLREFFLCKSCHSAVEMTK